ncbi:unnamed protein product [Urochloa decumbens]|uniref:F-box domain-containing protein n=1 Tax=Urochloa decumbens TaxID=240449 RepID=A0ABC9BLU9_9POAL
MDTPSGKSAKATDEGDRISGLPDEVRQHVLSFLPAREAVRTCVLSTRWHDLWASVPRLNVAAKGFTSQSSFIKFVNALLISRGCIPLKSFWLRADGPDIFLNNFRDTAYLWIRYALRNNVEELGVIDQWTVRELFQLQYCPFTSSCLKKLHLCYIKIDDHAIKKLFSGCPALEDLEMINCEMFATELSSATLKSLSIDYVDFPYHIDYDMSGCYIVINMPSLVSLHIGALLNGAMLSVVDVRLGALSNVKKLELLFSYDSGWQYYEYSMQDDTNLCGVVFTNLITLSLSDWCLYDNCKLLLYLLEHSPNLEKLTLMMTEPHFRANIGLSCSADAVNSATPFNCEKLRKLEIVCSEGDKIVGKLVTILLTKMKSPLEISIKPFSGVSRCLVVGLTIFTTGPKLARTWKICLCSHSSFGQMVVRIVTPPVQLLVWSQQLSGSLLGLSSELLLVVLPVSTFR